MVVVAVLVEYYGDDGGCGDVMISDNEDGGSDGSV